MAGFVAPSSAWQIFNSEWSDLLTNAGLKEPFSMKHLAHFKGQFKPWKGNEELRQLFIGRAIKVIVNTGATPLGAIVSMSSFQTLTIEQQRSFLDPYYVAFQNCTRGAAVAAAFEPDERVTMVYRSTRNMGRTTAGELGSSGLRSKSTPTTANGWIPILHQRQICCFPFRQRTYSHTSCLTNLRIVSDAPTLRCAGRSVRSWECIGYRLLE